MYPKPELLPTPLMAAKLLPEVQSTIIGVSATAVGVVILTVTIMLSAVLSHPVDVFVLTKL